MNQLWLRCHKQTLQCIAVGFDYQRVNYLAGLT